MVNPGLYGRWAVQAVLLLAEVLILSLRFNSALFRGDGPWWANVLSWAGWIARPTVAAMMATMLIGAPWLRQQLRQTTGQTEWVGRTWPLLLLAHIGAFAAFACLTVVVMEGNIQSSPHPGGWVIAWAAMGLAMLGLWAAAAISPRLWWPLARAGGAAVLLPGILVGIAAAEASRIAIAVWEKDPAQTLTRVTLWSVYSVLHLICPNPISHPEEWVVGTPSYAVKVYGPCSGSEAITLILVVMVAYLAIFRRDYRFPRALLLLPLGVCLMWLANVLRIVLLVTIGTWGYPAVAENGFHTHAGWLAFNLVSLGLVVSSRRLRFFAAAGVPADSAPTDCSNPTAAYLVPLLAIIAATMITGAFSSGFDHFYAFRVLAAAAALWCFRPYYAALRWTWSWTAVALGAGTFVLWMALEPTPIGTPAESGLGSGLASLGSIWGTAWLAFRVAGLVVTVPLAEELAFRGYLTRRLIANEFQAVPLGQFTWFSFLLSSTLFGALHGRWLAGMLAGMLYAVALYRRGELADAVVAHATTNALIAAYVLTTGSWSLWE